MTVRKQYPARSYETFADGDDAVNQSPASYQQGGDADKSRSAAAEARRLASQGSWADSFGGTPATDRTPLASTVDGDEQRDVRYPETQDGDPSDPPPVYTPSVSTQVASQSPVTPASPVAARSFPVQEPNLPLAHSLLKVRIEGPRKRRVHHHCLNLFSMIMRHKNIPKMKMKIQTHSQFSCNGNDGIRCHGVEDLESLVPAGAVGAVLDTTSTTSIELADSKRYASSCSLYLLLPNFGKQPPNESWPPEKREHREHETYRSISGTYQLYDLLDLSTTSGSITVTIEVQPGTKPAVLRLASTAGSVHVRMTSGGGLFKKSFISDAARSRVVKSDISTSAGSVSGDIVHGNGGSAAIATNAGSINLSIYTVGVSELDAQSNLSTVTNQGSQHIKVYSGVTNTEPIRAMSASHTVRGSGSMNIDYPNEWEGTVHVTGYGSGSIGASGRGLVVRKESSHELYGYKGSKEGRKIEISEIGSGSVRFSC
ncbi:hypothetical protein H2200_008504 [Cladophialophora chaetospira]|uniref:Uncharacterized protein n=1 Tax=Cladophialophora chaetospira TaxID=386627 RepID=A0AA38X6D8_9EURO|nr:hypothetical protein H2200_008504 [Cladophialophora chaetospira]